MGQWFDEWLATVKADKRARTFAAYSGSVRQLQRPALGTIRRAGSADHRAGQAAGAADGDGLRAAGLPVVRRLAFCSLR
jgi:hypothetical protein